MSAVDPGADRRTADLGVDLYWLPLGAGDRTHLVALSGRLYEHLVARRDGREPRPLFHSALLVHTGGATYAVEMAPVWRTRGPDRGVAGEGAVGWACLGRSRWFRYEVRRWRDGCIPDLAEALDSPLRLSTDQERAAGLLGLIPEFPRMTWGRDDQNLGDMWNSNSLISWALVGSGHDTTGLCPPNGGRAPGWDAGVAAANRQGREKKAGPASRRADRVEEIRTRLVPRLKQRHAARPSSLLANRRLELGDFPMMRRPRWLCRLLAVAVFDRSGPWSAPSGPYGPDQHQHQRRGAAWQ